jgi:hypothetical protein
MIREIWGRLTSNERLIVLELAYQELVGGGADLWLDCDCDMPETEIDALSIKLRLVMNS